MKTETKSLFIIKTKTSLLQVLDLHGNMLTGAPPDHLLYYVHALLSLNVSNNRLTSAHLGPGFRYVTQLADIDLSGM